MSNRASPIFLPSVFNIVRVKDCAVVLYAGFNIQVVAICSRTAISNCSISIYGPVCYGQGASVMAAISYSDLTKILTSSAIISSKIAFMQIS